jgi:hypothetical protein
MSVRSLVRDAQILLLRPNRIAQLLAFLCKKAGRVSPVELQFVGDDGRTALFFVLLTHGLIQIPLLFQRFGKLPDVLLQSRYLNKVLALLVA